MALNTLVVDARAAYEGAIAARSTSRTATNIQSSAVGVMAELGGDYIKTIRAFAETTGNPSVYDLAELPPPAPPAPLGPPATPTKLTATLNTEGQISLRWGGTRAGGTSYLIERSINSSAGPWTLIGASEERSFLDEAVPTATQSIAYRVFATRSGGTSPATAPITVLFGNTSGTGETESGEGLTLAA